MDILIRDLEAQSKSGSPVQVRDSILHANFCLQSAMSFGFHLNEAQINKIQSINRRILLGLAQFKINILNAWPKLTRIIFPARWAELEAMRLELDQLFLRLIKARQEMNLKNEKGPIDYCYVDSLLELKIPSENACERKLTEKEMVSLCNEFINAGTDLPTTELQWALANIVRSPNIQAKLVGEIKRVVGPDPDKIREEDLGRIPYIKAVILEVLRRHPSAHLVIAHRVMDDMEVGGYLVPKNSAVNVFVAEIGRDPNVWEDPMEFKPERFMDTDTDTGMDQVKFDVTARKEIKMMPFGVGRRMCPGNVLARLNLEYLVANLVWRFEWNGVDGEDVDLSEQEVFTIMMKSPLKAHISPRKF